MDIAIDYLPLLVPLITLELVLMIMALIHVVRHPQYRIGNQVIWIIVVLFIQILGPIAYFVFGRGEE